MYSNRPGRNQVVLLTKQSQDQARHQWPTEILGGWPVHGNDQRRDYSWKTLSSRAADMHPKIG
jgi:hypothetical protein